MSLTPVIVACFAVAVAAWLHHAVAEHHWHLHIAHWVSPRVEIPETRHDSMWHAMGHGARLGVDAGLLGAAVLLGTAWQLERTATTVAVVTGTIAWLSWLGARGVSKALGQRHRTDPDTELED
jgi:hypothetical protein